MKLGETSERQIAAHTILTTQPRVDVRRRFIFGGWVLRPFTVGEGVGRSVGWGYTEDNGLLVLLLYFGS